MKCTKCGKENGSKARFCARCGASLEQKNTERDEERNHSADHAGTGSREFQYRSIYNTFLKALYYITKPFMYIEAIVSPFIDHYEEISTIVDIIIVVFCFLTFRNSAHDATEYFLLFLVIGCILIPILKIGARIFQMIVTYFLIAVLYISALLTELHLFLGRRLFQSERKDDQWDYEEGDDEYFREDTDSVDEVSRARTVFGFYCSFTMSELKARRRELMKQAHPDAGGNVERAKEINAAFDILSKYAAA